jgi:mycothiol synthase
MPGLADLVTIELPDGLTSRPATPHDAPTIYELIAACELEDDGVVEVDRADTAAGFERHGFEPATDTVLVFDDGTPVAWAELYRRRAEGDVVPRHRGRGIGAALLRWIEARARSLGDPIVGQTTTDGDAGARGLFLANGYSPAWVSWIIRIELTGPPAPPAVPSGISIRAYNRTMLGASTR